MTVLSLLVVTLYASDAARRFFRDQTQQVLESRARVLGRDMANGLLPATPAKIDAFCKEVGKLTGARITVIKPDGTVLGDTDSNAATMENHAGRPEIEQALSNPGTIASAVRESPTMGVTTMYAAIAAQDPHGTLLVLRAAMSLSHIDRRGARPAASDGPGGRADRRSRRRSSAWSSRGASRGRSRR